MSEVDETRLSDELTKFGLLVIVMIVVVLVVALSRPLIFDVIVPVVLGDGLDTPVQQLEPISPAVEAPPVDEAPAVEAPTDVSPASQETEVDSAAAPEEESPVEAEVEAETLSVEALPTLVTAKTHVVKTGETLTVISNQHDVSVQSIVNANNLASADRIKVGDLLTIPQE